MKEKEPCRHPRIIYIGLRRSRKTGQKLHISQCAACQVYLAHKVDKLTRDRSKEGKTWGTQL